MSQSYIWLFADYKYFANDECLCAAWLTDGWREINRRSSPLKFRHPSVGRWLRTSFEFVFDSVSGGFECRPRSSSSALDDTQTHIGGSLLVHLWSSSSLRVGCFYKVYREIAREIAHFGKLRAGMKSWSSALHSSIYLLVSRRLHIRTQTGDGLKRASYPSSVTQTPIHHLFSR